MSLTPDLQAIYDTITLNETSFDPNVIYGISVPVGGLSGWTIGATQMDFRTNPKDAQAELIVPVERIGTSK